MSPTLGLDVSLCPYICSGSPGLPLKLSSSCPRLHLRQAPCLPSQKMEKPLTPCPPLLLWSWGSTEGQPWPDASSWWLLCNFPVQMSCESLPLTAPLLRLLTQTLFLPA